MNGISVEEMPSYSHTLNRNSNSSAGSQNWVLTDHEGVTNWQTDDVGSTGGNAPHNNMEPYKVVYIFRRNA